jgi:hypothetical protein
MNFMLQRVKPLIATTCPINEMEYNVEAMKIVPHCRFFFFSSSKTSRCKEKQR